MSVKILAGDKDIWEVLRESFQSWTPAQQARFRAEVMSEVHAQLAAHEWERDYPHRPYQKERVN